MCSNGIDQRFDASVDRDNEIRLNGRQLRGNLRIGGNIGRVLVVNDVIPNVTHEGSLQVPRPDGVDDFGFRPCKELCCLLEGVETLWGEAGRRALRRIPGRRHRAPRQLQTDISLALH